MPAIALLLLLVSADSASIEVDASKAASFEIPRGIFGTFLEPIGNSIYGGIWAQLLENPSFEENLWSADALRRKVEREPALAQASGMGLPVPWQPLDAAQGARYEPRWHDAANSSRSLLIMALPGKQTGVRQEVYLPVHRVLRYTGSVFVKPLTGATQVEVSLRRRNRPLEVLSSAAIAVSGTDWRKYEFSLEVPRGKLARLEPADFAVAVSDEARVLVDQVILNPADHVDGLDPEMVALSRDLKTPLVRFGGNYTSGYHFRDGLGPMDKRVSMLNQAWGMPEYNHFGTDEYLRFCELTNSEPMIALNLGSGTPQEAADWVRYVNEKWKGGSGGLIWELGNELWGNFQIGYPTLERVAERTRKFSEAVLQADPKARLIATGQDPDHFREWNAQQLQLGPGLFQYLSTHFVVGNGNVRKSGATPDFVALSAFALPIGLERHLHEMKSQIDQDARMRGKVRLAFTEWLFHAGNDRVPHFGNMGGAICAAGMLNVLMRVADFTPISAMTGLIEFGGIWKKRSQVYGVPAYWAFRMYSAADIHRLVESRTSVDHYDIHEGNNRIPEIPNVPYLDVVSALSQDGRTLSVFAVNRHLTRDIPAAIKLAGFAPAPTAATLQLRGDSIYQANDELRPEAVRPREGTFPVNGTQADFIFPRTSVTLIQFSRR